jgi:hypothetical protein
MEVPIWKQAGTRENEMYRRGYADRRAGRAITEYSEWPGVAGSYQAGEDCRNYLRGVRKARYEIEDETNSDAHKTPITDVEHTPMWRLTGDRESPLRAITTLFDELGINGDQAKLLRQDYQHAKGLSSAEIVRREEREDRKGKREEQRRTQRNLGPLEDR